MRAALAEDQFAKIFVIGYQNPIFVDGFGQNIVVGSTLGLIENGIDFMPKAL